jgi:hypothetical protein
LLANIKTHPAIVPKSASSNGRPEIVTYSEVRKMIVSTLYHPLTVLPGSAEALARLKFGDGIPVLELSSGGREELPSCDSNHNPEIGNHHRNYRRARAQPMHQERLYAWIKLHSKAVLKYSANIWRTVRVRVKVLEQQWRA